MHRITHSENQHLTALFTTTVHLREPSKFQQNIFVFYLIKTTDGAGKQTTVSEDAGGNQLKGWLGSDGR